MKYLLFTLAVFIGGLTCVNSQKNPGYFGNKIFVEGGGAMSLSFKGGIRFNPFYKLGFGFVTSKRNVTSFNYINLNHIHRPESDRPYEFNCDGNSTLYINSIVKSNFQEFNWTNQTFLKDDIAPLGYYISYGAGFGILKVANGVLYGNMDYREVVSGIGRTTFVEDTTYQFKYKNFKSINFFIGYGKTYAVSHHLIIDFGYRLNFMMGINKSYKEYSYENENEEFYYSQTISRNLGLRYMIQFNLSFKYLF